MNINSLSGQNPINSPDPNTIDNTQAQSTNLSSETKSTVAKSDSVNNINNVDQNIGSLESKTQNNNMSANMLKNNLLAKVPNNQTQPASTLSTKLSQIKEFSQDKNYPLTLSLPKDSNNQPIDSNKLTVSDYENTFIKETLREVGINNVTDKEVKLFQQEYKNATGKDFSLKNSLTELRSNTIDSKLTARVSQYDLAVAKTVGLETIIAQRQTRSQVADQAYENGTKYVDDLMKGYIAARINAPANLINGATEPIRGLAAMNGIDLSNLVVPRLELAKESEYWNKGSRIGDEELGTTLGLATVIGGNVDKQLLSNPVGKTIVGVESAYNIGTGLAGVDPTEQTNGQYREMGYLEQGLRIVGGGLGAYSLSKNINADNLAKNQPNTSTVAQEVEAVTPEGFKVKVNTDLDSGIKQAEDLNLLARSPEEVARAKKLNETLTVSKKEEVVHGGSIDRAGFRKKIHESKWSDHGDKHLKAKTEQQAKELSQTGKKAAQYLPGLKVEAMEKEAIWKAIDSGQFIKGDGKETYYFFHKFDDVIGYNTGNQPSGCV
ncbi:MAG: hypothetical protein IPK14_15770 [Blastocatellia bacterium]|nr:hypothetical protein [Blastocatellia bacterium]